MRRPRGGRKAPNSSWIPTQSWVRISFPWVVNRNELLCSLKTVPWEVDSFISFTILSPMRHQSPSSLSSTASLRFTCYSPASLLPGLPFLCHLSPASIIWSRLQVHNQERLELGFWESSWAHALQSHWLVLIPVPSLTQAVWPYAIVSLSYSFLICKMGTVLL